MIHCKGKVIISNHITLYHSAHQSTSVKDTVHSNCTEFNFALKM
jgi:hypothetical protein